MNAKGRLLLSGNLHYFAVPLLITALAGFLSACTLSPLELGRSRQLREFQTRPTWVRQGPEQIDLSFRPLTRAPAYLSPTDAHSDLVIQANASDGLVGYRRSDGQEIWRTRIAAGVEAGGVGDGKRFYVGGLDGQFYAIDIQTGRIAWTFPTRAENLSAPLLDEGILYFQTGAGSVFALDSATGNQKWFYGRSSAETISVRGGSRPAASGDRIFVGFPDGALVALQKSTGVLVWEKALNRNKRFRDLDTDPIVANGVVFVAGYDDAVYALQAGSGDVVWKTPGHEGGHGNMLIASGRLIVSGTDRVLVRALDLASGQEVWRFDDGDRGVANPPVLYRGLVTFGVRGGLLYFLDAVTGRRVGSYNVGKGGISSVVATEESAGRIYFVTGESAVVAMSVGWELPPPIDFLR